MESKHYAVIFKTLEIAKNVFGIISKKNPEWKIDESGSIFYEGDNDVVFLNECNKSNQFENIMWYTPEADTPEKVIEWIKEIFYGKQV